MGDPDDGGGDACVEGGGIGEISVFSCQFHCKPKTVLKKLTLHSK